jgi:hypothetical protein
MASAIGGPFRVEIGQRLRGQDLFPGLALVAQFADAGRAQ